MPRSLKAFGKQRLVEGICCIVFWVEVDNLMMDDQITRWHSREDWALA
jgi:hypothetical protein